MEVSKSFKDTLDNLDKLEEVQPASILTGVENINMPSENTTIEEAEKIWPILEASLNLDKGIGLSAVQIGILKRVALINYNNKIYRLLNTKITKQETPIIIYGEGCLSIPGKTVNTERYANITIQDDVLGEVELQMSRDALLPIAFQHEVDHFDGKTILDRKRRPIVKGKKIGRNAPCPCGSGKKYKKCCLPKDEINSN